MMKIAFVLAAATAVLTTSPPATPAKAQDLKVDIQIGRTRYDRYDRDRDYRVSALPRRSKPAK
jgi:ABC-type xylose transport system substrate-binding protein